MKGRKTIIITSLLVMLFGGRCLDPYQAPSSPPDIHNLVVEGFYDAGEGKCTVKLSRVITVADYHEPPAETYAQLSIVDEDGAIYDLTESEPGVYVRSNLTFAENVKIQLKIKTLTGDEYESAIVPVLHTPPIDSVTWESGRLGVNIKVSSHNENDNRYYYWRYVETWYYTARFNTNVILNEKFEVIPKPYELKMFECWKTVPSSDIMVSSSSSVEDNLGIISEFPLTTVLWNSPKLQIRYSILVEQRSVTKETFEYLDELKKNTENLGTLFDPLPSAPGGNIRGLTHPEEAVMGNFSAGTIERKRIFFYIQNLDRPVGWYPTSGDEDCFLYDILFTSDWFHFVPVGGTDGPWKGTSPKCVDCRFKGGSTEQPDFWVW